MTEMSSAGYYIHLELYLVTAHLYLCHLVAYSYMQCKEMLYRLCSLQTNVCISLHHQSDVLQHSGTNDEYLCHKASELGTSDCKCQADMLS